MELDTTTKSKQNKNNKNFYNINYLSESDKKFSDRFKLNKGFLFSDLEDIDSKIIQLTLESEKIKTNIENIEVSIKIQQKSEKKDVGSLYFSISKLREADVGVNRTITDLMNLKFKYRKELNDLDTGIVKMTEIDSKKVEGIDNGGITPLSMHKSIESLRKEEISHILEEVDKLEFDEDVKI